MALNYYYSVFSIILALRDYFSLLFSLIDLPETKHLKITLCMTLAFKKTIISQNYSPLADIY